MFKRQQIKQNAKLVLRRSYWTGFLVSLIVAIVTGRIRFTFRTTYNVSPGSGGATAADQEIIEQLSGPAPTSVSDLLHMFWKQLTSTDMGRTLWISAAVMLIITLAWKFFVETPVRIGLARFYAATREQVNPVDFSYVFYGFKKNYFKKTWAYFSTLVMIALWRIIPAVPYILALVLTYVTENDMWINLALLALPCMIPVAVKEYQYMMVPYIIANNGEIGGRRARELSTAMTGGNKWKLFILDLSFIGWILLGMLGCFIGILFVVPYINAAQAEAYTCLKTEAMLTKGVSSDEELPSFIGAQV